MSKRHQNPLDPITWSAAIAHSRDAETVALVSRAISLYDSNDPEKVSLLQKGLSIADILLGLQVDKEALAAALLYPARQNNQIQSEFVLEHFGEEIDKLLRDILQMQSLSKLQHIAVHNHQQTENLRKMLLAMVTDVRSVLIILAERIWQLHRAKQLNSDEQHKLAHETLNIYAPLANRLGVWQLKWEIEDLCLRYTDGQAYSLLAKGIAAKRGEREAYIQCVTTMLNDILREAGIKHFEVTGRVKHIYSIYKKMQRKNANLEKIYDMSALRVLVQEVEDCYTVLSALQNSWESVPEEFDDYIADPKSNGYRSIHIVVVGPEHRFIEIQIRTYRMHQESELGVAAHWRYKEGGPQNANYEAKIALLRQIMAWQKEVTREATSLKQAEDLFADRIYVFTPLGDIIELAKGATPLDFAYHIHSEVGHRCRGAKVDGVMVPLTYTLQSGQRVEILTAKQANPSRDWANVHLGYLKTPRARAKVQHWFRLKDNIQETPVAPVAPINKPVIEIPSFLSAKETSPAGIQMTGINNLLTHMARCCKPLPGDTVVGYITRNRGVSIHRKDCPNLQTLSESNHNRLLDVYWGEKALGSYRVDLLVRAEDRTGILRDITSLLAAEKTNIVGVKTFKAPDAVNVEINFTLEVTNREELKKLIELLQQVPSVLDVYRR